MNTKVEALAGSMKAPVKKNPASDFVPVPDADNPWLRVSTAYRKAKLALEAAEQSGAGKDVLDAARSAFKKISYSTEWQLACLGKYLVKTEQNRLHAEQTEMRKPPFVDAHFAHAEPYVIGYFCHAVLPNLKTASAKPAARRRTENANGFLSF